MIPDPLHPAVVHIPIAIAIILPVLITLSMVLIRRGTTQGVAWLPVAVLSFFLFSGALLAQNTGESEEEAAEEIVEEQYIEEHEEQAELFTIVAGVLFAVSIRGLAGRQIGNWSRIGAAGVSILLVVLAFQTGHSGGELVYKHGAAAVTSLNSETSDNHDQAEIKEIVRIIAGSFFGPPLTSSPGPTCHNIVRPA